jgi:uncharacterized protein
MSVRVPINLGQIAEFCRRWKITELSLSGSVIRGDFRPDSDVDVLVAFASDAPWSLLDLVEMKEQLGEMFGREVHLVEKTALRNPFRRQAILSHREVIFAA